MSRHCALAALALLFSIGTAAAAQAQRAPDGWRWQVDRATGGAWKPEEMVPGMHITTASSVVLFAPGEGASGRFMVDAELLLFPDAGDRGYGIAFGGRGAARSADEIAASWTAFLVSADGRFAVVRSDSGKAQELVGWRAHDAIVRRSSEVITNRLRVSVDRDSVRFVANGKPLAALARGALEPEGLFGLRIDEGMNLHVTNVDVVRRLLKR